MKRALLLVATALTSLSASCGGLVMDMTHTHAPPRPMTPRPREQVELLGVGPSRPYTEVGVITFTSSQSLFAPSKPYADDVAYAIWSYAGKVGCDAVVLAGRQGSCLVYDGAPAGAPTSQPQASASATAPRAP